MARNPTMKCLYIYSLIGMLVGTTLCSYGDEPPTKASGKHFYNSYIGKQPPAFDTEADHWVNNDKKLTLEKLHGQVVWLEFNF